MLELFRSDTAAPARLRELRDFLDRAFEGDLTAEDWKHALGGWHVTITREGRLEAHGAVVPRRLEIARRHFATGYVEAVAVEPSRRGRGIGTKVMRALERRIRREYELGALSTGAHGFYTRLGWERWRGPSYVRRKEGRVRTETEDDGLMVLRFGESFAVDLAAPIVCQERPGDDW